MTVTCTQNQFAHPGIPDLPAPRRTKKQVEDDVNEAIARKEDADRLYTNNLKRLAAFEKRAQADAAKAAKEAVRPSARPLPRKVPRTPVVSESANASNLNPADGDRGKC
ncbi:hypothetical protein EW146_g5608 [Bondarzewia mesenterica]|uniref:Uncharacterized protein n=1 Tax=Bondarzewia mesenterica TaxID=1095465 RepID=A0A4S4LQY9_9AGAM|nr:hypothetical protein EW146_g5608 [Bondarzewia mesenterica]